MSEARSAAGATFMQQDESTPLRCNNVSEDGDDRYGRTAEKIWGLQDLSEEPAGVASALQQIQSLWEKKALDVPTTVLEIQKLKAQRLATMSELSVLSAAYTAGSDRTTLCRFENVAGESNW